MLREHKAKNAKLIIILTLITAAVLLAGCGADKLKAAQEWFTRGQELSNQKKYEEAINAYDKSIELNPANVDVWTGKGFALFMLHKYENAIKAYDEAIELLPNDADLRFYRGTSLVMLDRRDEALKEYNNAIERNPNKTLFLSVKFGLLRDMGKIDDAIKVCDRLLELDPNDFYVFLFKASCYSLKGDRARTLEFLGKVKEYDPKYLKMEVERDKDFQWLWEDEEFKKLMRTEEQQSGPVEQAPDAGDKSFVIANLPFTLTATVVTLEISVAFFVLKTSNKQINAMVGDTVDDGWVVLKIGHNRVKLKKGRVKIEMSIGKPAEEIRNRYPEEVSPELNRYLAHPTNETEAALRAKLKTQTRDVLIRTIISLIGVEPDFLPEGIDGLADFCVILAKLVLWLDFDLPFDKWSVDKLSVDELLSYTALVELQFSTEVNLDNSPVSPRDRFKQDDGRIYVCFPNAGQMKHAQSVIMRWVKDWDTIEHVSSWILDAEAGHNFVWLEKEDGWAAGFYTVRLFSGYTDNIVAEGRFKVEEDKNPPEWYK